jgi:hypothetical protein
MRSVPAASHSASAASPRRAARPRSSAQTAVAPQASMRNGNAGSTWRTPMLGRCQAPAAWKAAIGSRMNSQSIQPARATRPIRNSAAPKQIKVGSGVFHSCASR